MNYDDMNFDYTLPEDSEVKNNALKRPPSRKIKSNGKTNNQINENSLELKENQLKNLENDDILPDFYKEDQIQNINSDDQFDENNENYENYINDNKIKENNLNNITNNTNSVITNNRQQSRFLSTNNDKIKSNNQLSRLQQAEANYEKVKMNIERIIQEEEKLKKLEENCEYEALSEVYNMQNLKLVKNLEEISQILNLIIGSSKIKSKRVEVEKKEIKARKIKNVVNNYDIVTTENKLVEVFKTDYKKLKSRVEQVNGDNYEDNLSENLKEITQEICFLESDNKGLKLNQKQSEVKFERQGKSLIDSNVDIKKISSDYQNTRKLNEQLIGKIEKNKIEIDDNERKCNEINEKYKKFKEIAENYGINESFINKKIDNYANNTISYTNNDPKLMENIKFTLLKNSDILEKASLSNKHKYEAEISRNIKSIYSLESNVGQLYRLQKDKTVLALINTEKVREQYDLYNATTSSTINSNKNLELKNNLMLMNKNIYQGTNEAGVLDYNTDVIPERVTKFAKKSIKLNVIERNNVNRKPEVRKTVKNDKTKYIAVKNKDPSIIPDDDDTYFTHVSPNKNDKEKMYNQDKELKETLLKAQEFVKSVQKNNSLNAKFIEKPEISEEKIKFKEDNILDNVINNVDEEPIVDLVEKYENLNKKEKKEENNNTNNKELLESNDKTGLLINENNILKSNNNINEFESIIMGSNIQNITKFENKTIEKDINLLNLLDNDNYSNANNINVKNNINSKIEINIKDISNIETAQITPSKINTNADKINRNDVKRNKEKITKGNSNLNKQLVNLVKDNSNSDNNQRNSNNNINRDNINNNKNNKSVDKKGEVQKRLLKNINKQNIVQNKNLKPEIKINKDDLQDLVL